VHVSIGSNEDHDGCVREAVNLPAEQQRIAQSSPHDMVALMRQFVAQLSSRDYPSLELTSEVFADEFHITVAPLALSRGLRWQYDAPT
jgi:hypothetical protein